MISLCFRYMREDAGADCDVACRDCVPLFIAISVNNKNEMLFAVNNETQGQLESGIVTVLICIM